MLIEMTPEQYAARLELILVQMIQERQSPFLIEEVRRLWHETRRSAGLPVDC